MMVRFLSQDGNVMSEEFMGKTDRWDGSQGVMIVLTPRSREHRRLGSRGWVS